MQRNDNVRSIEPGERDPNMDTNSLVFVLIILALLVGFGYVMFPRHNPDSQIGPGATASSSVSGRGPDAPAVTRPAPPSK
jgi:hypothetical protein